MKVTKADAGFRPIVITLESAEEFNNLRNMAKRNWTQCLGAEAAFAEELEYKLYI